MYIGAPLYALYTNAIDVNTGIDLINRAIEEIRFSIQYRGGDMMVQVEVMTFSYLFYLILKESLLKLSAQIALYGGLFEKEE